MSKKKVESESHVDVSTFEENVDRVAVAVKKLTDAGMGAPAAGALAWEMLKDCHGSPTPTDTDAGTT